jgi:hypothetical protein
MQIKEGLYQSLGEALLRLAVTIALGHDGPTTVNHVLQLFYQLLSNSPPVGPAIVLYADAAVVSDLYGSEAITTEFFASALKIWRETVPSPKKYRQFVLLLRAAVQLRNVSAETYTAIASDLCVSAWEFQKPELIAEAQLLTSHLFNVKSEAEEEEGSVFRSVEQVKNSLVRCLKAASTIREFTEQIVWYYRVLGHAIYFIEAGFKIPPEWFAALTGKIDQEHEAHARDVELNLPVEAKMFYATLIAHMEEVLPEE